MIKLAHLRPVFVAALAVFLAGCSAESRRVRVLERAAGYQKTGDFEKARIEFQNVLQKHPDDVTANEGLALIWFDRGSTMRALAYLSKVTVLAPGNLEARLKRAQLISMLGKAAEARREAMEILRRSPSISEALVVLTETIRDADDLKATEEFLQKFHERDTVSFHIASANLQNLRGDRTKAKAALDRALALDAQSPAAHSAMAGWHAVQKNPTQALAEHKIAADLSPLRSRARLQHAGYLAQSGAVPEAVAALKEIVRQAPDYLHAWRALAQIALAEKRHDDALGFLQTANSQESIDYEALILRGRVLLAKGEVKRAIEELNKLGETFKGVGLEKYYLALAHLQDNDAANALVALQQTVAQYPDNVDAILLLAQLQLRAGTPEPVLVAMVNLVNRRPDLMPPFLLLIEGAKALGKLDAVVEAFTASLATAPNNPQMHYLLGLTHVQREKPAEARRSFEKTLELLPNFHPATVELVNVDLKEGKAAAALKRAQALVAAAPQLAAGHLLSASAYAAQRKWGEVEAAAIESVRLDPNHAAAYGLLVQSFAARKDQPGMGGKLEAFLAKFPNELFAVRVGAQVYIELKDYPKARDLYEKFLATSPNFPLVLNNLANLYAENLRQPERALELARKARALAPTDAAVADTLGWILFQRKEYPEALSLLEESVKTMAASGEVQYHVGMANRALGRNAPALAAFRLAVAAAGEFPGKDEAKRQLAELEKAK